MAYFTVENLLAMKTDFERLPELEEQLFMAYLNYDYQSPRAKEFAHHGFLRRVKRLRLCTESAYKFLPPETDKIPSPDDLISAEVNIQAFVVHVFGCLDNLAWVWVLERNIRKSDGSPLPNAIIGLRKDNKIVRESLPTELLTYLEGLEEWILYLENFRHSLAHRIPLYIPPYTVRTSDEQKYSQLGQDIELALKEHDFDIRDSLIAQRRELERFIPWIQHSFIEEAKPIVFHVQMIVDFKTVHELGLKLMDALST